ncbi:hypothetical protein CCP4SC76_1960002 [Gammaproteobacteria bacterium]
MSFNIFGGRLTWLHLLPTRAKIVKRLMLTYLVVDTVKDVIGVYSGGQDVLVAKLFQMLGHIALCRTCILDNPALSMKLADLIFSNV